MHFHLWWQLGGWFQTASLRPTFNMILSKQNNHIRNLSAML